MKKYILTGLVLLLAIMSCTKNNSRENKEELTTLVMGSWRTDDVQQLNALLAEFSASHPSIKVEFQPTNPPDYNAALRLQLENGTGPDLMYARSFTTGEQLFKDGYFEDLSDLAGLTENYDAEKRSPWLSADSKQFAIPFVAVSHGIYYNKDIFAELNISLPANWDEFLAVAQSIKDAGYIPLANALGDEWDINEVVFMSIAPNFIGGEAGRIAYDNKEKDFNGPEVVELFEAMQSLEPFLPEGYKSLTYNDSSALFATGEAAMFFDGSWSINNYNDVDFDWGILPPPPPAGASQEYITFHADAGMAINAASKNKEAARILLEWFGSAQGAQAVAKNLPTGFFPMSNNPVTIEDSHANEFLALNNGRSTDVRWAWPKLLGGEPSGYVLMQENSIGVIVGDITPQEAADNLKAGLATWYAPAQ